MLGASSGGATGGSRPFTWVGGDVVVHRRQRRWCFEQGPLNRDRREVGNEPGGRLGPELSLSGQQLGGSEWGELGGSGGGERPVWLEWHEREGG